MYMQPAKKYIILFIFISCAGVANSQSYQVRDGWGILLGGNFSDIVGRGVQVGNEPKLGLRGGFSLESTAIDNFYFRSELLYNQKGARISAGIGQQTAITQTYHTVELPVLGCFEFTKGISIGGGLYLAYLIDASLESQFGGTTIPIEFQEDDLRKLDFGYAVELNILDASGLQGGIRYQRSISTINNSIDRYHQVISAYVGLLFNNAK